MRTGGVKVHFLDGTSKTIDVAPGREAGEWIEARRDGLEVVVHLVTAEGNAGTRRWLPLIVWPGHLVTGIERQWRGRTELVAHPLEHFLEVTDS